MLRTLALTFAVLTACGVPKSKQESKYPARRQCFELVNGQATMEFQASVLLLTKNVEQCTGTFVSDRLLLTAAHCVQKTASGGVAALLDDCAHNQSVAVDAELVYYGDYAGDDYDPFSLEKAAVDAALVVFPPDTAPATVPLAVTPVGAGEKLQMVGFGSDKPMEDVSTKDYAGFEYFVKRSGVITTPAALGNEPLIQLVTSEAGNAYLSRGDSGGPLLLQETLVGIASFGLLDGQARTSGWVNVQAAAVQALVERAQRDRYVLP